MVAIIALLQVCNRESENKKMCEPPQYVTCNLVEHCCRTKQCPAQSSSLVRTKKKLTKLGISLSHAKVSTGVG